MCCHQRSKEEAVYDPTQCPFTIRQLNDTTYIIRENDRFGEFPHIYIKLCTQTNAEGEKRRVLLINDTGVGTNTSCHVPLVRKWNIASFIEQHLNPTGELPYLVLLSHCHYDHILGLNYLMSSEKDVVETATEPRGLRQKVTVVSSSHAQSFVTPYEVLMEHSLCTNEHLRAPKYKTSIWAADNEEIMYEHPDGGQMHLPIVALHTPGHTPDSLSWYDAEERALYVGDSFYTQESTDTQSSPWGPENPASILFPNEGDLATWWWSLKKLAAFVEARNIEGTKRITLSAGHVATAVDAAACVKDVKGFMTRVLRDETYFEEQPAKRGARFGHWTENKPRDAAVGAFSLGAPLRVVREGRKNIPQQEWRA